MYGIEPMDFSFHDEDLAIAVSSDIDTKFDETIGHIEDIIMEEEFQILQNDFLEKYFMEFDDTEENKFIYTDIHREYIELVEKYLEDELTKRLPDFSMVEFTRQIMERRNELEGEIFEMLLTFSDFMAFKEMFLDYRADKEGRSVDLSSGITVTSVNDGGEGDGFSFDFAISGQSFGPK